MQPSYIYHSNLFNSTYFERVLSDEAFPRKRELSLDGHDRLEKLIGLWLSVRPLFVKDLPESKYKDIPCVGLPASLEMNSRTNEDDVENRLVLPVYEEVLGFECQKQQSMELTGLSNEIQKRTKKPDLVIFPDKQKKRAALNLVDEHKKAVCAISFCSDADFIVDAKKFSKGIGADEESGIPKEGSAAQDIEQVSRYLQGCGKKWGVLTNGRCWRLMRAGAPRDHLRFDLVLFLEHIISRENLSESSKIQNQMIRDEDLAVFNLFWYFFGLPAVSGGYLDLLLSESEANTRRVKDILRENAHIAVQEIAQGFLRHPENGYPEKPGQAQLDHLREISLVFLYRLLFVLKAEAQGLLKLKDDKGAPTLYAKFLATKAVFELIHKCSASDRTQISNGFNLLKSLFDAVNTGSTQYDVPAYNGGLFDPENYAELDKMKLTDDAVYAVLNRLIYLDEAEPVPYADLDVRDFGDIYEGLLEQRLVLEKVGQSHTLSLRNKKGERKASGSYFTPDSLVDHVVRATIQPLLDECGNDPEKILALKVLDPSMGSGHFLVKTVDVMAWHLTLTCKPLDKTVLDDNGPEEYTYWKHKVVENCIYGIDFNPMAVELAKVALWLHTASYGHPLSFIDNHLKCGNSLVGASLSCIARPSLKSKTTKEASAWVVLKNEDAKDVPAGKTKNKSAPKGNQQILLPFPIDTSLFSGILESVNNILRSSSRTPSDVKAKRTQYLNDVNVRLKAHRILCDLWCAQWFIPEPDDESVAVYESARGLYARVKQICGITDHDQRSEALNEVLLHPFLKRVIAARKEGYGPKPMRFFHWQLEFPEAAFTEQGILKKDHFGFDAIVGNPPWDKIKPAKRDFYGPFNDDVANRQGPSLDALIRDMEDEQPELAEGWRAYETMTKQLTWFLGNAGIYKHQTAFVEGKKTGGDPDLFKFFVERSWQGVAEKGRIGLVLPATIWQAQGCTGLRRLLFEKASVESLYTFENYRKWAFDIHSSFKFTTLEFSRKKPKEGHSFPAAFMLRDTRVLEGKMQDRVLSLNLDFIASISPESLALIDNRSDMEVRLIERLHQNFPALGSEDSGWNITYRRELDMTNDAWLFKTREWMASRGFTRLRPEKNKEGQWVQKKYPDSRTVILPDDLPQGGEYWVSANESWYRARGYAERKQHFNGKERTVFYHPDDNAKKDRKTNDPDRILPGEIYFPLYEGRMVHIFDHSQKAYVSGEGRKAIWQEQGMEQRAITPRVFVCKVDAEKEADVRIGFCDVTGATNERSILSAIISSCVLAGNTVATLEGLTVKENLILLSVFTSFCADYLIRQRVSQHLNWTYVSNLVVPNCKDIEEDTRNDLAHKAAILSCTTPELAEVWNAVHPEEAWTYESAERDLWKRAELRAEIDAIVAELYGLSVEEYAMVLTGFPLLDRDQPALPGDAFLTEGDEKSKKGVEGESWFERDWGIFEIKPRSFITRDFALLTYMKRKAYPLPQDLGAWFRDKVGLDPEGPLSRFMIGAVVDLEERVATAKEKGAIPYVPTSRG
jgi:hypothetical protein